MKKLNILLIAILLFLLSPAPAFAHCPLCVAGAGAGLSISRLLGIDDSITGIWFAAFLGATSMWGANSLRKKYIPLQNTVVYIFFFALTIWSFYRFNLVNEHAGLIMGAPKLIFGMVAGGTLFYLADVGNGLIRKINGKVLFPYQPIVFSLGAMVLLSIATFIFINYYI
jgi:hypothetical protein